MRDQRPSHLFVGSTNPVKLQAAHLATQHHWPELIIQGFDIVSAVAAQPLTDAETRAGATHRARMALKHGLNHLTLSDSTSSAMLGIGMEGGVYRRGKEIWNTVWICVVDDPSLSAPVYESNGAHFKLPSNIGQPILQGQEMAAVFSNLFDGADIRSTIGAIGALTNQYITRAEEYAAICALAIGLWYGRSWQE
jgi:inosine/xanthosine triphosphatase